MKVLLSCTECNHEEWSSSDKVLMNRIIMWNHVKKAHYAVAERTMRTYHMMPSHLFSVAESPVRAV